MNLPSASHWNRLQACPFSAGGIHVQNLTEHAERGTQLHTYHRRCAEVGRDAALAEVPEEWRQAAEDMPIASLPGGIPGAWSYEWAFAYDVETGRGRHLEHVRDRDYGELYPWEIPGTADFIGLDAEPDLLTVGDLKTGRLAVAHPSDNLQVILAALAACSVFGPDRARVGILYAPDGSEPRTVWAILDPMDLAAWRSRLRRLAKEVRDAQGDPEKGRRVTGDHCRYCPRYTRCPEQTGLIRHVVQSPTEFENEIVDLCPDEVGVAWERVNLALLALRRIKDQLKDLVWSAGMNVPLSNGKRLGIVEHSAERVVDGRKVHDVLGGLFGQEVADVACEFDASKASIQRALKPYAERSGVQAAALLRDVLESLRQAGAIETKTSTRVDEIVKSGKSKASISKVPGGTP